MKNAINPSMKPTTRNKAAKKAQQTGEISVVYETEVGKKLEHLVTTESLWDNCPNKDNVAFIGKVDQNGNNVD